MWLILLSGTVHVSSSWLPTFCHPWVISYWGVLSSALHLLHSSHLWFWRTLECPPLTWPSYSFFECRTSLFETVYFKSLSYPSTFLQFASVKFSLIYVINEYEKQNLSHSLTEVQQKNKIKINYTWALNETFWRFRRSTLLLLCRRNIEASPDSVHELGLDYSQKD